MNVASLELSKELYELSGWEAGYMDWHYDEYVRRVGPKYDLGYLLRKLPEQTHVYFTGTSWATTWNKPYKSRSTSSDSPENAAAKLAIELFKQGILTKERS